MKVEVAERRELSDATVLRLPLYLEAVAALADLKPLKLGAQTGTTSLTAIREGIANLD